VRNAGLVNYFLYKNFCFVIVQAVFGFYSGFTSQNMYDDILLTLYNLFYTAGPPLFYGFIEKDVDEASIAAHPELFREVQTGSLFSYWRAAGWMLVGILHSLINFALAYGAFRFSLVDGSGRYGGLAEYGVAMGSAGLLLVQWRMMLHIKYWNGLHVFAFAVCLVGFYAISFITGISGTLEGVHAFVWSNPVYWFYSLLLWYVASCLCRQLLIAACASGWCVWDRLSPSNSRQPTGSRAMRRSSRSVTRCSTVTIRSTRRAGGTIARQQTRRRPTRATASARLPTRRTDQSTSSTRPRRRVLPRRMRMRSDENFASPQNCFSVKVFRTRSNDIRSRPVVTELCCCLFVCCCCFSIKVLHRHTHTPQLAAAARYSPSKSAIGSTSSSEPYGLRPPLCALLLVLLLLSSSWFNADDANDAPPAPIAASSLAYRRTYSVDDKLKPITSSTAHTPPSYH
jgi:hypothetical protein